MSNMEPFFFIVLGTNSVTSLLFLKFFIAKSSNAQNLEDSNGNSRAHPVSGNPPDQIRKSETEGDEKKNPPSDLVDRARTVIYFSLDQAT